MDRVKLGKVTSAVGIKGEVRVYPYTDEIARFSAIKELELEGEPAAVEGVRYQKDMVILKLDVLKDRNAAEAAKGKNLWLPKEKLWEVPEDTYFNNDLLGMKVSSEDGSPVGTLTDVIQNTSQDLYEITKEDGGKFLLPAVKAFILNVDIENKCMKVHLIEGLTDL